MTTRLLMLLYNIINLFQNQCWWYEYSVHFLIEFFIEIVIYSLAVITKNTDRCHVSFTHFPPVLTFCKPTVYHNQDIRTDKIHEFYSEFHNFTCASLWVCVF